MTPDLLQRPDLDASETSFSNYVRYRAVGGTEMIALPAFFMRGFRQHCILVRKDSDFETLAQLDSARIGLTGWPDSGNTWTRSLLRREGVSLDSCQWFVGKLHPADVKPDPQSDPTFPANVTVLPVGDTLVEELEAGRVDAIMTPFMPPDFYTPASPFRQLLRDYAEQEKQYYRETGFIPGIHVLAVRTASLDRCEDLPAQLLAAVERSWQSWWETRCFLVDGTPLQFAALDETFRTFGENWSPFGLEPNRPMIEAFCAELLAQGILPSPAPLPEELFPACADKLKEHA